MAATLEGRARELIEAPNFCHLASHREDGSIHTVVVWAHPHDGEVWLNSAEGRVWPANVRRDPQVTLTIANSENPYEYVEVQGRVVGDAHGGADEDIGALGKKYMGVDTYPFRQEGEQRVIFKVQPEKVRLQKAG